MLPALKKLRALWPHREGIFKDNPGVVARVKQIFEIADRWDSRGVPTSASLPSPEEEGIPINHWVTVKKAMREAYATHQIPDPDDVEDIEAMLCIGRPINGPHSFRVSSNADAKSEYETESFNVTQRNPESWVGSYNYPFQIIRRYYDPAEPLEYLPGSKFIAKYLWLLRNRELHLPILSFASFLKLTADLKPEFGWIDRSMPFATFQKEWPAASSRIVREVTGKEYDQLSQQERRELAQLVFIATIQFTSVRNAMDMLDTGSGAMIFHGPPGTGKTWHAKKVAQAKLGLEDAQFSEARFSRDSQDFAQTGSWEVVQFHPNYTYHDFIGGIVPSLDGGALSYTFREGIFLRFCKAAKAAGKDRPFILIIDEINRADLAAVFGELMYAIEYRNHSIAIPHIGDFEIPENVRIIGTMNSNDRSLVNFDLALRRRFLFYKLTPDLSSLHAWNDDFKESAFPDEQIEELILRAEALNKAIANPHSGLGLPADYAIGQAYFMKIGAFARAGIPSDAEATLEAFHYEQLWVYHLLPLIEEYLGAEAENEDRQARLKQIREAFTAAV